MKHKSTTIHLLCCVLLMYGVSGSSCSSYRVATQAQGSTDNTKANRKKVNSYLWGLLNDPQTIHTPICDKMDVVGVSEVVFKRNAGDALLTFFTLGIYSPAHVSWKCSKPCPVDTDPIVVPKKK